MNLEFEVAATNAFVFINVLFQSLVKMFLFCFKSKCSKRPGNNSFPLQNDIIQLKQKATGTNYLPTSLLYQCVVEKQ